MRVDIDGEQTQQEKTLKKQVSLQRWKSFPYNGKDKDNSNKGTLRTMRSKKFARDIDADVLQIDDNPLPKLSEEEEAVGIITMEDLIEELLQVFEVLNTILEANLFKKKDKILLVSSGHLCRAD